MRSPRQLAELETYHVFGDFANRPALELADRLAGAGSASGSKVFLTNGGGDSIETATKLARLCHAVRGEPERTAPDQPGERLSRHPRDRDEHPRAAVPRRVRAAGRADLPRRVGQPCCARGARSSGSGAESVAAFVFEPVIGSGGVLTPPEGYLREVERICRGHGDPDDRRRRDLRLRTAREPGSPSSDSACCPDLIVFAKGVTSGYLPLGGVIAAPNGRGAVLGRDGAVTRSRTARPTAGHAGLLRSRASRTSICWPRTTSSTAPSSSSRASMGGSRSSAVTIASVRSGAASA